MKMINGKKITLLKSAWGFIWLFIPILFMPIEKQNSLTNFDPMKGNFQKEIYLLLKIHYSIMVTYCLCIINCIPICGHKPKCLHACNFFFNVFSTYFVTGNVIEMQKQTRNKRRYKDNDSFCSDWMISEALLMR